MGRFFWFFNTPNNQLLPQLIHGMLMLQQITDSGEKLNRIE